MYLRSCRQTRYESVNSALLYCWLMNDFCRCWIGKRDSFHSLAVATPIRGEFHQHQSFRRACLLECMGRICLPLNPLCISDVRKCGNYSEQQKSRYRMAHMLHRFTPLIIVPDSSVLSALSEHNSIGCVKLVRIYCGFQTPASEGYRDEENRLLIGNFCRRCEADYSDDLPDANRIPGASLLC